jgi:hypothetical protein
MLSSSKFWCKITNTFYNTLRFTAEFFQAQYNTFILLFTTSFIEKSYHLFQIVIYLHIVLLYQTTLTIHRPNITLHLQYTINCYSPSIHSQLNHILLSPNVWHIVQFFLLNSSQIWPLQITAVCHNFRSDTQLYRGKWETVKHYCMLQNRQAEYFDCNLWEQT